MPMKVYFSIPWIYLGLVMQLALAKAAGQCGAESSKVQGHLGGPFG